LPDPDEPVVERVARSRARRSLLARLHLTPARHV
jgi:hypothetical protein